jgi:hypothetical protein
MVLSLIKCFAKKKIYYLFRLENIGEILLIPVRSFVAAIRIEVNPDPQPCQEVP